MTPVNVLYCDSNVDGTVGGSYYSLLYLVSGLDRTRFRPIVVFYSDHRLIPAYRQAGVETIVWKKVRPFDFGGARQTGPLRLVALSIQKGLNLIGGFVLPALARAWFLRRRDIRILHLNNSVLHNHDWMLAAKLTGTPCVTHERGINDRFPAGTRYFGRSLRAVICISDAVRANMQARGADFGNLVTIPNGLDPTAMRLNREPGELRRAFGIADHERVVGMIGNIKAWKGQDTLIRAIDEVRRDVSDLRCVLVGDTSPADKEYERTLRELVAARGLERHVVFAGFQQDVADFMMMFDIVVHASVLPEPFGRVILEAMACRKPVIGSRAGAIPEIIEEGRTGLMFPPGDERALAAAIRQLVGDPSRASQMGVAGYDRLIARFHVDRNTEATERLYGEWLRAAS